MGSMGLQGIGTGGSAARRAAAVFLSECYEACRDDDVRCLTFFVEAGRLWSHYCGWCREGNVVPVSPLELGEVGKEVFGSVKWRRLGGDGPKVWANVRRRSG